MSNFINIDRNTPMLLPPDLRDWVPENHLCKFILDVIDAIALKGFRVNQRGSGSKQYPPSMLLALLIYCYVTGRFSSRAIERASYDDVAVRLICANTHPDHDTICKFRSENGALFKEAFVRVLEIAQETGVLSKLGTVSVDGTKVLANASKHSAVSYDRAQQKIIQLELEVEQLMSKAEEADATPLKDGLEIPDEIARREARIAKLQKACETIEARAQAKAKAQLEEKQEKRTAKEAAGQRVGKEPQLGKTAPEGKDQYNFTDPESRIMKAGNGQHFEQAYNAQAAVEVDSRLIVSAHTTQDPNDKKQLVPVIENIPIDFQAESVLADSGYYSEEAVKQLEKKEPDQSIETKAYIAVEKTSHHRSVEDLEQAEVSLEKSEAQEQTTRPEAPGNSVPGKQEANGKEKMAARMKSEAGRAIYKARKETVEPVFGIIKEAIGFRRFSMRGKKKADEEWDLVCCAYNFKRLYHLQVGCLPEFGKMRHMLGI